MNDMNEGVKGKIREGKSGTSNKNAEKGLKKAMDELDAQGGGKPTPTPKPSDK